MTPVFIEPTQTSERAASELISTMRQKYRVLLRRQQ
jgi:predicted DNA-binding protein (UPF0278 family)